MKKILLSLVAASTIFVSCDNASKTKTTEDAGKTEEVAIKETAKIDSLTLAWTGYKTTAKTPVSGVFKNVEVSGEDLSAEEPAEMFDGATFTATVASLFSGNEIRDPKLKDIFFGTMANTAALKGTLHVKEEGTVLEVTMNDVTKEVPVTTSFENGVYTVEGDVHLADFSAMAAVEALAKACYELHTGIDGVSKTWDEAHFKGAVYLAK
ncbi:YceI family protein [Neptunitalea lumnitzerae]|uniref:Polyisoprenoid-binding protein n=1 Tax=Neptunitalea lumnitzerae TaxID=2965509 RepID=A0ABQ5MLH9_9FLAO|nr:YceI family protein [Neptunitalea sp. Y10]GLB50223.1 polyisoprenoid-binding protein [Neptunitalea sp. Y10]